MLRVAKLDSQRIITKFSVYIARETRMSALALDRPTKICEETVPGEYEIEVIDIAKHPDIARNYNIVATPAVFRTLPAPLRKSIGDLSDKDKSDMGIRLTALQVVANGDESPCGITASSTLRRSQVRVDRSGCSFYPTSKDSRLVGRHLIEANSHEFVLQVVNHGSVR